MAAKKIKKSERECARCRWKFKFISARYREYDKSWHEEPYPPKHCKPCRDILNAEGKFQVACRFFNRAFVEFKKRWTPGTVEMRRALMEDCDLGVTLADATRWKAHEEKEKAAGGKDRCLTGARPAKKLDSFN